MNNIMEQIYDGIKQHIEKYMPSYIDELNTTEDYHIPQIEHVYREYIDIYELPTYPAIVFGYGQITFSDNHPTNAEHWQIPMSLYAVMSGADSTIVHKLCEAYSFLLFSIFSGEDNEYGIVGITGIGISPVIKRQNNLVQVGYIDIQIDVSVQRKQT